MPSHNTEPTLQAGALCQRKQAENTGGALFYVLPFLGFEEKQSFSLRGTPELSSACLGRTLQEQRRTRSQDKPEEKDLGARNKETRKGACCAGFWELRLLQRCWQADRQLLSLLTPAQVVLTVYPTIIQKI